MARWGYPTGPARLLAGEALSDALQVAVDVAVGDALELANHQGLVRPLAELGDASNREVDANVVHVDLEREALVVGGALAVADDLPGHVAHFLTPSLGG